METRADERQAGEPLVKWTRRLAEGDDEAWRWFHDRYYLPLLRYAASRADASNAGDIVQQAYLRIARHAKPFTSDADFWGWLCCVVRCAAVDHARSITRRFLLLEKFAHWRESQASAESDWHSAKNDAAVLTGEVIAQWPDDDAALLRRKYCEGWSTQELAAELGVTPKAIESRLARLRERLRKTLLQQR